MAHKKSDGDYTSSIFVSQDPVAIDSVGADFLINEPTVVNYNSVLRDNPNVENYLHEAGLVGNAPSGTVYTDGNGKKVENLGVHEHWNNSVDKQYSRNLGGTEGIELILLKKEEVEDATEMKMNVQVGNVTFTATLEENAATRELVEMMKQGPVSIRMNDYAGFEKVGALGRSLTTENRQTTTSAGDIVLYNGNQIVIFYGSNSWSYTRLGKIDDLSGWEDALGSGSVTVTFSLAK